MKFFFNILYLDAVFEYFTHWANFNMLGIKMHILELRNSMVVLSNTFRHSLTQFHAILTRFWLFQPFLGQFQHVGYQKHVLELRNSMVILSHTFLHSLTQFHAILSISALFGPISTYQVSKCMYLS